MRDLPLFFSFAPFQAFPGNFYQPEQTRHLSALCSSNLDLLEKLSRRTITLNVSDFPLFQLHVTLLIFLL